MRVLVVIVAILSIAVANEECVSTPSQSVGALVEYSCPPGLFFEDGYCRCGVYPHELVTCDGTSSFILKNSIATFNEQKNITAVGYVATIKLGSDHIYTKLPGNANCLDDFMCSSSNRTGTLCGRCLPHHYPLAYSFDVTCIPCPNARWNWVKYIMAAYLPLTLFYIVIVFFKINTISGHLFAPVFYYQTLTMPLIIRSMMPEMRSDFRNPNTFSINFFFALGGIWNLDFFRPFYSDLCLGIGILPTLALDYAIAVYPLLLIIVSYLLITLYDRNNRVVAFLWTPFRVLSTFFQKQWDIRTSVVNSFAAFFFLSNMKFLSVSFDLLIPTKVYELYRDHYNYTLGLYYAGDVEYFGKEHLPYALLAIAVICVFVFLPMAILAFYPFRWFQSFLNLFPVRWYILHTFVDSFYGYYKNGTQPGMRDYRWCASVFFFLRFCQFFLYAVIEDKLNYNIVISMVLAIYLVLIAVTQPFSIPYYNTINTVFLHLLSLISLSSIGVTVSAMTATQFINLFYWFGIVFGASPLLYFVCSFLYWIHTHRRFAVDTLHRLRAWRNGYTRVN